MARNLDGNNDYMTMSDESAFDGLTQIGFMAWNKHTDGSTATNEFILHADSTNADTWGLFGRDDAPNSRYRANTKDTGGDTIGATCNGSTALSTTWICCGYTYNATDADLWVDGTSEDTQTEASQTIRSIAGTVYLGCHQNLSSNNMWYGDVGEYAIWNRSVRLPLQITRTLKPSSAITSQRSLPIRCWPISFR